jgi:hypothetical protein
LKTSRIAQLAILTVLSGLLPVLSQAATSPLNYPYGLAINASGDLYVANTSGNNILIYSPSHIQTGTITQGISGPNGVAVDPSGNLWVANGLSNSVTNYSPAGIQNTSATITSGVNNPTAIAVDGLSDVLIVNNYYLLGIWPSLLEGEPLTTQTFGGASITGVTTYKDLFLVGGNNNSFYGENYTWAQQGMFLQLTPTCFAPAFDVAGDLYCGNIDNTLTVLLRNSNTVKVLANLPFFPNGIATDSKRGWIYLSNGTGNEIAVYNTKGKLVHTIK